MSALRVLAIAVVASASIAASAQAYDQKGSVINGVAPEFELIADGKYPVSRSLYFYVEKAHVGVIPGMVEYVQEFTSERTLGPEGYLADKGLIPLPDDMRKKSRSAVRSLSRLTM